MYTLALSAASATELRSLNLIMDNSEILDKLVVLAVEMFLFFISPSSAEYHFLTASRKHVEGTPLMKFPHLP